MAKKLRLLIVDDEKYVRNLLRISVDWEQLDIEICGEATCAEEGLLLTEELQPDIIFTDICMDYMDGIEFSRRVSAEYPHIKIVILSGHSRFEYAASSIEAGVSAYLLKPLDEEKVVGTIKKIRKAIDDEESRVLEMERLKSYLEESRGSLIEANLNALMESHTHLDSAIRRLDYLGISFQTAFFQVASIKIKPLGETCSEEIQFLQDVECHHIILELLNGRPDVYTFFDLNHRNTILSNDPGFDLTRLCSRLLPLCLERMDCSVTAGIGNPVKILSQVKTSCQTAREAVRYQAILGNNQVISYHAITVSDRESDFHLDESIAELIDTIKNEQLEDAFRIVSSSIASYLGQDNTDIIPVRVLLSAMINHITELLLKSDLRDTDAFRFCLNSYERLFRLETVEELQNMTNNLIRSVIETFGTIRSVKNNALIESVIAYLNDNYTDPDITLNSTAGQFYVNSSYLSRLFKQQTGTAFIRYLTELRLNRAAKLLTTTSERSYAVAQEVGFRDAKYFSTCFRKYFGVTANDYRSKATDTPL